MTRNVG